MLGKYKCQAAQVCHVWNNVTQSKYNTLEDMCSHADYCGIIRMKPSNITGDHVRLACLSGDADTAALIIAHNNSPWNMYAVLGEVAEYGHTDILKLFNHRSPFLCYNIFIGACIGKHIELAKMLYDEILARGGWDYAEYGIQAAKHDPDIIKALRG
jgi:hypothetical protein